MRELFKAQIRKLLLKPKINHALRIFLNPLKYCHQLPKWFWIRIPAVGTLNVKISPKVTFQYYSKGEYIGRILHWRGIWAYEGEVTTLIFKLAQSTNVFIDIGANTGLYTLLALTAKSNMRVYAFEPVPILHKHLKMNIVLNNLCDKVILEQVAISDHCLNDIPFYISHTWIATSSLYSDFTRDKDQSEKIFVKTVALDAYVKQKNIQHVDLIKIDVEGAEADVLTGCQKLLTNDRPLIFCEILPNNRQNFTKIESILRTVQYEYALILQNGLTIQKSLAPRKNSHNFLLFPNEKRYTLQDFVEWHN